ncbi:GNAT family N-acetyltransferase [Bacillus mesophilum]|uniref:GNAT family N-acetyltransferase n=1 Tax=Bacillus mesophilum TaxID=1071718 RepID=A0A7V7RID9_9BACI|nr:GNAT family N-acetyltransferase [Bacillus mesophilum]KAB2329876.1 GNAT family N-acetyltransferase [Bacillus mesophilum]
MNFHTSFYPSFKILNGLPAYLFFEQNANQSMNDRLFKKQVAELLAFSRIKKLNRLGFMLYSDSDAARVYKRILLDFEFVEFAQKIEVKKDLRFFNINELFFEWKCISDSALTEAEFAELWAQCMKNSDNAISTLSIKEHMAGLKSELQDQWMSSCFAAFKNGEPIGISIPHIEPGTQDEGRLFYLGLLPNKRGNGYARILHLDSLNILKNIGASYYIGSTHKSNIKMKKVFDANDCELIAETESFYYYL